MFNIDFDKVYVEGVFYTTRGGAMVKRSTMDELQNIRSETRRGEIAELSENSRLEEYDNADIRTEFSASRKVG
jgi:hypothetical protein